MARYRKVDPRIWNDKKFRSLSDDAKLAFIFVLTHPRMTSLGAMWLSLAGLAEEIGWEPGRFSAAFEEFEQLEMVQTDRRARLLWLPNFLRYNGPESPNVAAAWRDQLDELPECDMLEQIIAGVESELAQIGGSFVDAWTHGKRRHAGKPDLGVIQIVRQRDGDNCRYCAVRVNWKDRKGPKGGTYDHVDPRGESTVENIVVACRKCNSVKGLRTPQQAKMQLLPSRSSPELDPGRIQIPPGNQEQEQKQEQEHIQTRADAKKPNQAGAVPEHPVPDPARPEPLSSATEPADREGFNRISERYPYFTGRQDWIKAEHACWVLIEHHGATWESLLEAVERYAAYVNSGGVSGPQFVMTPYKFFHEPDQPWRNEWKLPEKRGKGPTREEQEHEDMRKLKARRAAMPALRNFRDPHPGETADAYLKAQNDAWNAAQPRDARGLVAQLAKAKTVTAA